jgi:DNA polymerase-3 subunit gamma/tau
MQYLSLYRKWRPGAFEDVLGQAHVTETLVNAIRDGRVAHAYLFSGPRGTGKTSTARILAKALNCERGVSAQPCGTCTTCREIAEGTSLDVFEMDAASHTSVDDVREIRERIPFAAVAGGRKVYIIDEAHQLSTPAFNALLKILEEPPSHVVFVLCTTESHKLPATVVSRCQRFEFRRHAPAAIEAHLAAVAKQEGVDADEEAVRAISRHAHGSMRDALALLDQASGLRDGHVAKQDVLEILGETPEEVLLEAGEAIGGGDVPAAFRLVERMVERGWDPRQLLRQVLEHLRALLLSRRGADDLLDVDDDYRERVREQATRFTEAHLEWALGVLGEAQADVRWSAHPRLTLEVALARAAKLEAEDTAALRARLERLERIVLAREAAPAAAAAPAPRQPTTPRAPAAPRESPRAPAQQPEEASPVPVNVPHDLQQQWAAFLESVKSRKKTTHALLKEAWPIGVDGHVLVLGFEKSFHAENILKPDHATHLESAIQEAFGAKLKVRTEVTPGGKPARGFSGAAGDAADPVGLVVGKLSAEVVEEVPE